MSSAGCLRNTGRTGDLEWRCEQRQQVELASVWEGTVLSLRSTWTKIEIMIWDQSISSFVKVEFRCFQMFSDVFSCFLDGFKFSATIIITIVMQKILHAVSHLHQSAAVYWITVCSRPASIGTSFNVGQRAVGHMAAVLTGSWCNFRTDSFKSK
jgi:hypothetical protein